MRSWPPVLRGRRRTGGGRSSRQSTAIGAFSLFSCSRASLRCLLAAFSSSVRLGGYRVHLGQRICWQLGHSLSAPNVALHLWHVRRTRIRIGFSFRSAVPSCLCHSLGSSLRPNRSLNSLARFSYNSLRETLVTPSSSSGAGLAGSFPLSFFAAGAVSLADFDFKPIIESRFAPSAGFFKTVFILVRPFATYF